MNEKWYVVYRTPRIEEGREANYGECCLESSDGGVAAKGNDLGGKVENVNSLFEECVRLKGNGLNVGRGDKIMNFSSEQGGGKDLSGDGERRMRVGLDRDDFIGFYERFAKEFGLE